VFVPVESIGRIASPPDLLRLLAVPTFAWAAYRDVRTRRVANRTWLPLAALGVALLLWDLWTVLGAPSYVRRPFLLRVAVSLGVVAPLGYVFWRLGGFGGADAKALIALALAFPAYPVYYLSGAALPLNPSRLGVFSLTVLTNTVLVGLAYPLALASRNALSEELSPRMVVGKRIAAAEAVEEYGRLLEGSSGRGGLDLDALRMYLRWRGCSLAAIRTAPAAHRDPTGIGPTGDPGDGTVGTDPVAGTPRPASDGGGTPSAADGDPWGAARFLAEIDGDAYGTTAEELRAGLDALAEREAVWLTPGLPFIVPMFFGLLVALVYGDLLYALLDAIVGI
jgi:preflagellin peptidase FlaK